jgi:hypothetical protein
MSLENCVWQDAVEKMPDDLKAVIIHECWCSTGSKERCWHVASKLKLRVTVIEEED